MKRTVLLMMMVVAVLTTSAQEKRYGIESAILKKNSVIKMPGMEQTLSSTQYIADYGNKESAETVMSMQGQTFNIFTMLKDGYVYSANLTFKQGTKINMAAVMDDYTTVNYLNLTDDVKEKYQIVEKGNEQFLGKDCKSYEMTVTAQGQTVKVSVLVWQGLALKSSTKTTTILENSMTEETIEILEGVEIAKEKFELPEGINFTDATPQ